MHLTDEQLNEYLDNESTERAQIESHLAICADCAARFTALKTLFTEIESLPEITLTRSLVPHFMSHAPSLPRWLTLTAALQVVISVITLIFTAPFVVQWILPYLFNMQLPSFRELFYESQSRWMVWLDVLSQLQMLSAPEMPVLELSSMAVVLILAGVSILWIVGNRLLLRKQNK